MSRTDDIIKKIGAHFGVISKDGFTSMLLAGQSMADIDNIPVEPPINQVASLLNTMSDTPYTTPDLIDVIGLIANPASAGNNAEELQGVDVGGSGATTELATQIGGAIKICYGSDSALNLTSDVSNTPYILSKGSSPEDQGYDYSNGNSPSRPYSINAVAGLPTDENSLNRETDPNSGKTMSVTQVLNSKFSPANRDTGALTLFLNAMPTIEVSRAVPFIDVTLVQKGFTLDTASTDATQTQIKKLGLGQFLLGNAIVNPGSVEGQIIGAQDSAINEMQSYERTYEDATTATGASRPEFSSAGMELFTSPQTMINADEDFYELDAVKSKSSAEEQAAEIAKSALRAAPIIDKFRPLMTLKGINFQVSPSGGMMSYKSGKMKLVLHDRSRLAEIAPFVRPAGFGTTVLNMEYGWAHPDAQAHADTTVSGAAQGLFGEFIGSLRTKEKYKIVNSSFSFTENGEVEIEIMLSMLAGETVRQTKIGAGDALESAMDSYKTHVKMLEQIRSRISSEAMTNITGDSDIMGQVMNPTGGFSFDRDTRREINRLISASNARGASANLRALGDTLENMVGRDGQGGTLRQLRGAVQQEITTKINRTKANRIDPWYPNYHGDPRQVPKVNTANKSRRPTCVSLGKLLTVWLGGCLKNDPNIDDLQIITYNFNDSASYMRNRNIATFPIDLADFKTQLQAELDTVMNMSILQFLNFVNAYCISDVAARAYGFKSLYGRRDPEDRTTRQVNRQLERQGEAAFYDREQQVLRAAYGAENDATELVFKMPFLNMVMESVPSKRRGAEGAAKTVLKIHVFDSQNTSYTSVRSLLDASQSDRLGTIQLSALAARRDGATDEEKQDLISELTSAIDTGLLQAYPPTVQSTPPDINNLGTQRYRIKGGMANLKAWIMRTMPSVRYGQECSGITKATLSSMRDSNLDTINMLRTGQGPDDPVGERPTGLPTRIRPTQLKINTIGCPLWNFGQQIFVDFGTGTDVDNIYAVVGVSHNIAQGEYTTEVELVQLDTWGKYESLTGAVREAIDVIAQETAES